MRVFSLLNWLILCIGRNPLSQVGIQCYNAIVFINKRKDLMEELF